MEIIAHRGASFDAPENTLAAFRLGWTQTDTCELDIWLTADGHLLVCHDANTRRTTGVDKEIAQHTLSDLQQLNAGSGKSSEHAGEKLPSLIEVMQALPEGKKLLIEIKCGLASVPELKKELENSGKISQLSVQSFDHAVCVAAKKALPDTPVFYLSGLEFDASTGLDTPSVDALVAKVQAEKMEGLNLQNNPLIDTRYVETIHRAGLKIGVWTVDDPIDAGRLRDCGVDTLISNRPGSLRGQLRI
jgi:glycerophosphoryl diester phosphodiesterase